MAFIKIDRNIDQWEFRHDMKRLGFWIHLLLEAKWNEPDRGTLVTSARKLEQETGLDRRIIGRFLNELEDLGQIAREIEDKMTRITILNYEKYQDKTPRVKCTSTGAKMHQSKGTTGGEMHQYRCKNAPVPEVKCTSTGGEMHQSEEDTSLLNKKNIRKEERKNKYIRESEKTEVIDNEEMWFKKFWELYPRKKARAEAVKAFRKKCKTAEDFDAIMSGLRKVIDSEWKNKDPQYIPYPTTWINQERWNDDITPRKKTIDEMLMEEHAKNEQRGNTEDPEDNIFGTWWKRAG